MHGHVEARSGPSTASPAPPRFDPPLELCPLCRSPQIRPYNRDQDGRTIDRCSSCRVQFLNPQYSDAYLADFYSRYIGDAFDGDLDADAQADRKRGIFARAAQYVGIGRLLAIGCGSGLELLVAREQGWEAQGYDVDPATTRRIARAVDAEIFSGDFLELGLPCDHYHCVVMDQVLEHARNPRDYLVEIRRILAPGGVLFIGCPNIGSLANAGKTLLDRLRLRRHRGRQYGLPKHLVYYSPYVLKRVLERHYGFSVPAVQGDPLNDWRPRNRASWSFRAASALRRRVPFLDSTFQLFAQKRAGASCPPLQALPAIPIA